MRRIACSIVLAVFAVTAGWASSLWDQAVTVFRENGNLQPGYTEARFEQYNGRGELLTTEETAVESWTDARGEMESRIVYARRNGEDVTEQRRKNPASAAQGWGPSPGERDAEDSAFSGLQLSPFDPAEQQRVTITEVGPVRAVDGSTTRAYHFVHETGPNTRNRGTAWIDIDSGDPVRLHLTVEPLPSFVSAFEMRQQFARDPEGRWIVDVLEFTGAGGFLFFQRQIESRLEFSDYFRSE
jgi:hypothetical protein